MLVIPNIETQVSRYINAAAHDTNIDQHLFIVWFGGNDYLSGRDNHDYATTNTINSIKDQIEVLIAFGAKNFLVLNLPDLGKTPFAKSHVDKNYPANATHLTDLHNQKMFIMVNEERLKNPNVHFLLFDVNQTIKEISDHPNDYGVKNITDACYPGSYYPWLQLQVAPELQHLNGIQNDVLNDAVLKYAYTIGEAPITAADFCDHPEEYLYWDRVHPTAAMNRLLSVLILKEMQENNLA